MKRTIISGLVTGLCISMLAGCGGGTSETSDTKLLAQTGCASTYCYGYNVTSSSSIQFYVKSAPWADIHYTVNGGTQSNLRMSKVNGNNAYTITGLKSGDVVRYFFTIGNTSGGATDTAWMSASMSSSTPTPTPTPTTTPPSGYSFCANEGGSCSFSGTHAVAYGSGSTFTYRFREGSVNCNTTTFGDPVPGADKKCYYNPTVTTPPAGPTPDYIFCGKDDGMCSFSGTRQIAYGANGGPYAYRNATDRIGCNTTNFGDPAPGAHEYCWVAPLSPTPTPTPTPTPAGFSFGPYKDVTVNLNWNTNVMSTKVTGTLSPVTSVMPSRLNTVTWSFATGECGSENWGGVQGPAMASANVQAFVNAGKTYILSTGGAAGSFSCGSDSGFETFIQRYNSANLRGVDFDIEAGQTQSVIDSLIQRVKVAQGRHPGLRFSFTLATLGGSSSQSLGAKGVSVMNSIRAAGLTNYYINLMVMDYGSANSSNCTLGGNGRCDMGKSAIQAAKNLHSYWGVPYNRIELTPMIGGNDTQDETFDLGDVDEMTSWVKANGLAGIHYWSLDRDTDCAPGFASPTCNSYGQAGNWGFANRFIGALGL